VNVDEAFIDIFDAAAGKCLISDDLLGRMNGKSKESGKGGGGFDGGGGGGVTVKLDGL